MTWKKLFVKDSGDEEVSKKPSSPPKRPQTIGTPPIQGPSPVFNPTQSKNNYPKMLDDVMRDAANQQGLDYMEFSDAVNNPAIKALGEPQMYILAYPVFQSANITADALAKSADHYVQALEQTKEEFLKEVQANRKTEVEFKQELVKKNQQEIEELTKTIQKKSEENAKLNSESSAAHYQITNEENAFEAAFQAKITEIKTHQANIQKYLNNGNIK